MLSSALSNGTLIKGLSRLLDGGGIVGGDRGQVSERTVLGSYTVTGQTVSFHTEDVEGGAPVNILPYVAGAINYTEMQGRETISGEFTGCSMAIYNFNGSTRVCHVDTAKTSSGDAPSKATWAGIKGQNGFELADEKSTMGMLGDFLGGVPASELGRYANLRILCVAAPVEGITSFYVLKEGQDYRVLRRG
ncbi:MAG: hypothetical protein HYV16_03365 [Gammaproteobacteria bacterium]|nr:hypothetical protein [Gammaproteobacteria bacterium]